jgi:ribosomal protein L37E
LVLKARALGFEHAVGAVLTMSRKCGRGSGHMSAGACGACASSRERARETAPNRTPLEDGDTLSL